MAGRFVQPAIDGRPAGSGRSSPSPRDSASPPAECDGLGPALAPQCSTPALPEPNFCALRSDDTEAPSGVASDRLAVGSALILPHLFAAERLSASARERETRAFIRQRRRDFS